MTIPTSDRQWEIKCGAAIIGFYGALRLCEAIDMDPQDLFDLVRANTGRLDDATEQGRSAMDGPDRGADRSAPGGGQDHA